MAKHGTFHYYILADKLDDKLADKLSIHSKAWSLVL